MSVPPLVILRSSPYTVEVKASARGGEETVSFEEVKGWLGSGKFFKRLFRYPEVRMKAYDLSLIAKPFATALLVRLLSRGSAVLEDGKGAARRVTPAFLLSLFLKFLGDLVRKPGFLRALAAQVGSLERAWAAGRTRRLNPDGAPLYLRTDLFFGLRSGGSVGHIAGVLNNLDAFFLKPVFLTTDPIPTVRPDLETHVIPPRDIFRDFSELPSLYFNEVFYPRAVESAGNRPFSFLYQRYSLNNFSGLRLAAHWGIPFVLEYNGSEIWINRNWGTPLRYEGLSEKIERLNLKAADLVVVVSRPMREELVQRGVESDKILVNPNGVDPEKYSPQVDGGGVRKRYGLEGKSVVGFIGTFGRWHGAEVLAEAFGRLLARSPSLKERVRLLMVGDGVTMPLVKEALRKQGVEEACVLTGTVPQEEGPAHLAACDLLVASHVPNPDGTPFFGSPTKLFEYMAMGKGIVASDLDQIGEILKHDETAWMVKPGDPDSLSEGLRVLLEEGGRRERLGKAARKEAVLKYSWREHTGRIVEKLKQITG